MSEGRPETRSSERGGRARKGWHWPYVIVALLGGSLSANLALLVLALLVLLGSWDSWCS